MVAQVDKLTCTDFYGPGGASSSRLSSKKFRPTPLFATVVLRWPDRRTKGGTLSLSATTAASGKIRNPPRATGGAGGKIRNHLWVEAAAGGKIRNHFWVEAAAGGKIRNPSPAASAASGKIRNPSPAASAASGKIRNHLPAPG